MFDYSRSNHALCQRETLAEWLPWSQMQRSTEQRLHLRKASRVAHANAALEAESSKEPSRGNEVRIAYRITSRFVNITEGIGSLVLEYHDCDRRHHSCCLNNKHTIYHRGRSTRIRRDKSVLILGTLIEKQNERFREVSVENVRRRSSVKSSPRRSLCNGVHLVCVRHRKKRLA